jgi:hypothetical protein
MPKPTQRTLKRRLEKSRLESRLIAAEAELTEQKEKLRNALRRESERGSELLNVQAELQQTRAELQDAQAELRWIAKHAVAKTIGAIRAFDGYRINLSDENCAQASTEPSRG